MSNLADDLYATPKRMLPLVAAAAANDDDDEDLDDPDFEATPSSQASAYSFGADDLMHVDTTPVNRFLGRRSMSPITKSTQRMSKAMQVCSK